MAYYIWNCLDCWARRHRSLGIGRVLRRHFECRV